MQKDKPDRMTALNEKLKSIDEKLEAVERIEKNLTRIVDKEEAEVEKIEHEEEDIERDILRMGTLSIKRSHVLELARGTAGAFLGVGLGQALGTSVMLASRLPWINIFGILFFIILITGLLIYKNDKDVIKKANPFRYILGKISYLYAISLVVQLIGLFLFNTFPGFGEILYKTLIVGSYTAMSSAVAFTLVSGRGTKRGDGRSRRRGRGTRRA